MLPRIFLELWVKKSEVENLASFWMRRNLGIGCDALKSSSCASSVILSGASYGAGSVVSWKPMSEVPCLV